MDSKFMGRLGWLIIAGMLGYWGYVAIFGTGFESNGWEHFSHTWKGISLELGPCNQRSPEMEHDVAGMTSKVLRTGELVSTEFGEDDRVFYLFLREAETGSCWLVVNRAKSDYKGFFGFGGKIWLTRIPEIKPGLYLLVAGTSRADPDTLADGSYVQVLPSSLNYTVPKQIRAGP